MVTSRAIRTEVENILDYLLESDIALAVNNIKSELGVITWYRHTNLSSFIHNRGLPSISDYRSWVEAGDYSAILYDGALLQITYEIDSGALVGHRLAYVPPPFDMDPILLQEDPLIDVFDMYAAGQTSDVVLASVVRFDFDPSIARIGHPACHFTMNRANCRIACAGPLRLGRFIDFVFNAFYPQIWEAHPYFGRLSVVGWGDRTVSEDERQKIHLSWGL